MRITIATGSTVCIYSIYYSIYIVLYCMYVYSLSIFLNCAHVFRVYFAGYVGPVVLVLHGGGHSALSWALFTVSGSAHTHTNSTKLFYMYNRYTTVIAKTALTSA